MAFLPSLFAWFILNPVIRGRHVWHLLQYFIRLPVDVTPERAKGFLYNVPSFLSLYDSTTSIISFPCITVTNLVL
ncbi:hypothetical protein FT641_27125 [Bacillus paranthracis]|uniref:hypothetical protein n=1 Tax=Bacillus paranthracis TaxID=2026186 RepID=UPI00187A5E35|nr:hypothetical protein [Bacillus paranthracis]MBE7156349.1 hypothetical protein [Bacillus paranthracis]